MNSIAENARSNSMNKINAPIIKKDIKNEMINFNMKLKDLFNLEYEIVGYCLSKNSWNFVVKAVKKIKKKYSIAFTTGEFNCSKNDTIKSINKPPYQIKPLFTYKSYIVIEYKQSGDYL